MPAYHIHNLTKSFAQVRALSDVSFAASAGEFIVILGPTGAGKTTLLRTISGLEKPDSGTIAEVDNNAQHDITTLSPAERDMAMVFQNFSLYPGMSVYDNLAFPLRPAWRKIPETEIDRRVNWAADILGISSKLQNKPGELSGGQQQRVAIGRAIVREPRLFLFDEPLASLDAKLRISMAVEIHRLQRRLNVTMLYVTHDQVEAMSLADRMIVLDEGRILQTGAPDDVYRNPISPRVARMLGSPPINLLSPQQFAALKLQNPHPEAKTLGLRPEHISLTPVADGTSADGVILTMEKLGATTTAVIRATGVDLRALLTADCELAEGQPVKLATHAQDVLGW